MAPHNQNKNTNMRRLSGPKHSDDDEPKGPLAPSLTSLDLTALSSSVTSVGGGFLNSCSSITSLDLTALYISNPDFAQWGAELRD